MKPYITYVCNDPEFKTVGDLVSSKRGGEPLLSNYSDAKELLDYKGDTNLTNRERVLQALDITLDYSNKSDKELPLVIGGTRLLIPKSKLEGLSKAILFSLPSLDDGNDGRKFTSFISETQKEILNNPNYKSVYKSKKGDKFIDFYPQITVFIWSRVLNQVINVSPFIIACETNSVKTSSTFSLTLPPLISKWISGSWQIDKDSFNDTNGGFLANSTLLKNNVKENSFYFHNIITQNDLVFIQYETLELEKNLREKDKNKFTVSYSKLPKRVYDLIGVVDSNKIITQGQSAEISIQIEGRDLSKFLIDDGSYFWIEELLGNLIPDTPKNKKIRGRIYGRIPELNALGFKSIQDQLSIILKLFYTTGYYPNEIFKHWNNKNVLNEEDTEKQESFKQTSNAQKDFCLSSIKISRKAYGLSEETGEDQKANTILNSILGLIETDSLIVTDDSDSFLSPAAQSALEGELYNSDQVISQAVEQNIFGAAISACRTYAQFNKTSFDSLQESKIRDGIWAIFDIETDPSIANYRVYDNKVHEANGSILSSIQSLVEEPFMEVFTETLGDRFKLIARRQPFNREAYNDLVKETIIDEPDKKVGVIESEDIITANLGFEDSEIYTWFFLKPVGTTLGENKFVAYPAAIILNEYVDIWGSRPYQKETNYAPFISKSDLDAKVNVDLKQAIKDLKYMVDINAYLPFTRRGTITIIGDRKIKKNQAIRLRPTGEIYHVDSVQNNYVKGQKSIERTTTLQVSRGMVEKYMKKKDIGGVKGISYFDIVQTEYSENTLNNLSKPENQKSTDFSVKITKSWGVNKDVFEFFYKRKQFSDNITNLAFIEGKLF